MGDPECQTILPRLSTDFFTIIFKCVNKKLNELEIKWHKEKSICIVLCSKGYPESYKQNLVINLKKLTLKKNQFIFHAGTRILKNKIVSSGGRVLNIVTKSTNFKTARNKSLKILEKINWKKGFYRKDIGHKVIK